MMTVDHLVMNTSGHGEMGRLVFGQAAMVENGGKSGAMMESAIMKNKAMIGALMLLMTLGLAPLTHSEASEGATESAQYGIYYGDGLRYLAERRHDQAVQALFRAYGMEPSAHVMELIVEAYDAMGDCDAVERQVAFLERNHEGASGSPLTRCDETGELAVQCEDRSAEAVEIDGRRRARCGEVLRVPAGELQEVRLAQSNMSKQVTVGAGQREEVDFATRQSGAQSATGSGMVAQVRRLPVGVGDNLHVPLLPTSRTAGYRIYEAEDGLFHIWAPEEQGVPAEGGAAVEMICPEDAADRDQCVWVRESSGPEEDGQRRRFEIYVPRLP